MEATVAVVGEAEPIVVSEKAPAAVSEAPVVAEVDVETGKKQIVPEGAAEDVAAGKKLVVADEAEEEVVQQVAQSSLRARNRIQVSTNKKPLYFYVNLAKKLMQQHNEVVLSALGMAISTVVVISEILKNNGLATQKHILTSTVDSKDEGKGRVLLKPRIEILLGKTENFHDLVTSAKATGVVKATEA